MDKLLNPSDPPPPPSCHLVACLFLCSVVCLFAVVLWRLPWRRRASSCVCSDEGQLAAEDGPLDRTIDLPPAQMSELSIGLCQRDCRFHGDGDRVL